ncbi:MAG: hypothetical protein AB7G04_07385, partial [Hyphomonadaceae bacterium]
GACETGYGYNAGGGAGGGLSLSKCQTQALVGAAAGALLGGSVAGRGAKTEGAVLGGALGAAGTYGVCRYMDQNSYARINSGYQYAAQNNAPYQTNWQGPEGTRSVSIAKPVPAGGNCKRMGGVMNVQGAGAQPLPQETYCQGPDGVWRPAG